MQMITLRIRVPLSDLVDDGEEEALRVMSFTMVKIDRIGYR
jgi:hypothetical protein